MRRPSIRSLIFLTGPLTILAGDIFVRFDSHSAISPLFNRQLALALALSVGLWWALSRLAGGAERRWLVAALLAAPMALIVASTWGVRTIRGKDPTPAFVYNFVYEPRNTFGLLFDGGDIAGTAFLIVLAAVFTGAIGAYESRWSRPIAAGIAAAFAAVALAGATLHLPNPSLETPWLSDVNAAVLTGQTIRRALDSPIDEILTEADRERVSAPKAGSAASGGKPPNVVFIVAESFNRKMMSHHGYHLATTPQIDSFLRRNAEGVVDFDWAYANGAFSPTSLGTLFTGIYTGNTHERYHSAPTAWQYARARGMRTFLVATQDWTWANLDLFLLGEHGPDIVRTATTMNLPIVNDTGVDDRLAARRFVAELADAERLGEPWFGTFQTNATHFPYLVDKEVPWPTDTVEGRVASATRVTDDAVGIILSALEEGGHLEDTVVVFTADHGAILGGEANQVTQKLSPDFRLGGRIESCHPLLTRVPFFVYVPENLRGPDDSIHTRMVRRRDTPVSHADLLPTLLELWSMKPEVPVDGVSLADTTSTRNHVLCFTCTGWSRWYLNGIAVISDDRYFYVREDFDHLNVFDRTNAAIYRAPYAGHEPDAADLDALDHARTDPLVEGYLKLPRVAPVLSH